MEVVTNLTSVASRAIWGEPAKTETDQTSPENREPASGETGNVSAGEPYDKGNSEEEDSSALKSNNANDTLPGNTAGTSAIRSEHDTDKTGVTSLHNPTSATSSDKPSSSNTTSASGPNPSVGAAPSSGSAEVSNIRERKDDTEGPTEGSEEHKRIAEAKKEAEEASKVDVSGAGPKTLEEKAREGGGDIGDSKKTGDAKDEDGPQKESHGEGTGEKYVKSSGMKADGGDFDAANPGAGKEADRLLESKGIHHTPGKAEPSSEDKSTPASTGKEKLSLKEKIKAKLHKN